MTLITEKQMEKKEVWMDEKMLWTDTDMFTVCIQQQNLSWGMMIIHHMLIYPLIFDDLPLMCFTEINIVKKKKKKTFRALCIVFCQNRSIFGN